MSYQDRPYTSNPSSSRPVSYGQPYSDHQDPHAPIRPLYHESKDDLDQPFDVRADFDGDGPRWSDVYGTGPKLSDQVRDERNSYQYDQTRDDRSYKPVDSHLPPSGYANIGKVDLQSREELVSVPVLGPEWRKAELHEMTRRGQAEESKAKRLRSWRLFNRDQRGLFGTTWLTRRLIVFSVFFLCIAIGITLFFTLPRAPSFSFYEPSPFVVDNSTIVFSRTPTNFSFNANLNLLADTSSSYLPVHFTNIEASLLDSTTSKIIARGNYGNHKVEKSKTAPVIFPVTFSYSALNTSDSSWNNMYDACGHLWPGTTRPDLKFRLELRMSIIGLVGKKYSQTQLSDIGCPFELPQNGV